MTATGKIPQDNPAESSPYRQQVPVLLIVLTAIFMAVIDGTVVNIALPTITRYFSVDLADSQWAITAYLVTMTSLLLIFGKLSESLGRARLFFIGIFVFTASSLACGLSANLPELVLFRVMQGTGAAMLFSISSALIFETTPPDTRGRAMGYIGSTVAIGSITGPIVGGFVVDALGWEYIFYINIPIGIILIIAALKYLRFEEHLSAAIDIDWHGSAAMVTMFVSLILALGSVAAADTITPAACAMAVLFVGSGAAFVWHEKRCPAPLLDLRIFANQSFVFPLIALVVVFVANFMMSVVGPFYFEGVLGYRPSQVGLAFLITPAVMVIIAPIAGALYDRNRTSVYGTIGMLVAAAGFGLIAYCSIPGNVPGILAAFVLLGIGIGLFQSPNNTTIMMALPAKDLGVASSVTATGRNLGMALGVSFGSILLSYQLGMAGFRGDVMSADPALIASSISSIMALCCVLCLVVAGLTLKK